MTDDFPKRLNDALKYGADHATVENLLAQLQTPEHLATRTGHPSGDHTFRGVLADALQDQGRDAEADVVRSGHHLLIRDGRVVPGRWTWEHLGNAMAAADHALFHPTVMPPTIYRTTMQIAPDVTWLVPTYHLNRRAEDTRHRPHLEERTRNLVHHENGVPHVAVTDDTCNSHECPITEAARYFAHELLPANINWVEGEGLPVDREAALNHPLVKAVLDAPIEEPVPAKEAE